MSDSLIWFLITMGAVVIALASTGVWAAYKNSVEERRHNEITDALLQRAGYPPRDDARHVERMLSDD